jgi:hypothetical protein
MPFHTQSITPSDLEEARRIFDGRALPWDEIRFKYCDTNDRLEIRHCTADMLIATKDVNQVAWVEV